MELLVRRLVAGMVTVAVATVTIAAFDVVRVTGGSMQPALDIGDVVVVSTWAEPCVGDIILVSSPERGLFVHRICALSDGMFATRGDANPTADRTPVSLDQIQGVVVAVVPGRAADATPLP